MSLEQFTYFAQTYGSQVSNWPNDQHALFERWARTPEGQVILAEEERLDAIFKADDMECVVSPALYQRIAAIPKQNNNTTWQQNFWRVSAYGYAACIALGIFCGIQVNASFAENQSTAEVSLMDNELTMLLEVLS